LTRLAAAARRWIAVVTAPSSSSDVTLLKLVFWTALPASVARVVSAALHLGWPTMVGAFDLVWVSWLLVTTRERDQARAELERHRKDAAGGRMAG
jgi:hypothetical protein